MENMHMEATGDVCRGTMMRLIAYALQYVTQQATSDACKALGTCCYKGMLVVVTRATQSHLVVLHCRGTGGHQANSPDPPSAH